MRIYEATHHAYTYALAAAQISDPRIAEYTTAASDMPRVDVRYWLTDDGMSGFGITVTGELIGLFSRRHGRGMKLVEAAIQRGARKLDCFDGFLVRYYSSFGFVVTDREANWTPGGPDVVYMTLARIPLTHEVPA